MGVWEKNMEKKRIERTRQTPAYLQGQVSPQTLAQQGAGSSSTNMTTFRSATAPVPLSSSSLDYRNSSSSNSSIRRLRKYPLECSIINTAQPFNDFTAAGTSGPLHRLKFNSDGSYMAMATSESTVSTLKLPISRYNGDGSFYMAHNNTVTSVCFSHQRHNIHSHSDGHGSKGDGKVGPLVLSCSTDGTARLWSTGKVDYAAVCFTHDRCSSSSNSNSNSISSNKSTTMSTMKSMGIVSSNSNSTSMASEASRNRPFVGPVIDASFYYNDKYAVLGNGNRVMMYSYSCDTLKSNNSSSNSNSNSNSNSSSSSNDLKRLKSSTGFNGTGSYKRVHKWDFPNAQKMTSLSCANSVLSPLLFAATSDKSLYILDVVRGNIARTIVNAHDRSIHCITLPYPSINVNIPMNNHNDNNNNNCYNTFATVAIDNCISIWDLRSVNVTHRYVNHVNRREAIRCSFSPCMRYLACGSEDKSARLIDLRTGLELAKYTGHRDVVSDVAFHPIIPQLATSSFDGTIKFYCSSDITEY